VINRILLRTSNNWGPRTPITTGVNSGARASSVCSDGHIRLLAFESATYNTCLYRQIQSTIPLPFYKLLTLKTKYKKYLSLNNIALSHGITREYSDFLVTTHVMLCVSDLRFYYATICSICCLSCHYNWSNFHLGNKSAVDRGFRFRSGQTKDLQNGIFCFSAKHTTIRGKSKHCFGRILDNVSVRVEPHVDPRTVVSVS